MLLFEIFIKSLIMIQKLTSPISYLQSMKKPPSCLYYKGNLDLLNKQKIAVVGSRHPNKYAQAITHELVSALSQAGIVIVSGGAMGIDAIAHQATKQYNTIMVAGTGLDICYPKINTKMIQAIEKEGLVLSQFPPNTPSLPRNFVLRNELIVALSDCLIVAYADLNSGSIRSVNYALKMNKPIYVLPHRIRESEGTNALLHKNQAKAIYDIAAFVEQISGQTNTCTPTQDDFLHYCKSNPTYDEAISQFPQELFEYELAGKISVKNGLVWVN
jgi:DNA processing protein